MANYIELPGDKYGNRAQTNIQARVIEAEENDGRLIVISPGRDVFPWPAVDPMWWREVSCAPGAISEKEWAQQILALEGLPQWMIEAAQNVANTLFCNASADGTWEYGGMIPRLYGFMGQPLSHYFEQSGIGKEAVLSFCDNRIEGTAVSPEHLSFLIQYIQHHIHAPIWLEAYPFGKQEFAAEVRALRKKADALQTLDDIVAYINEALKIGLDPL